MNTRTVVGLILVAAGVALWWFSTSVAPRPVHLGSAQTVPVPLPAPSSTIGQRAPTAASETALGATAAVDQVVQSPLRRKLAELIALYAPPGELTADQASALQLRRIQAERDLVAHVAALGPGGARAVAEVYEQNPLRVKLLLLEGLGTLDDPESVTVLSQLLERPDQDFFEQEQIIRSLAQRPEAAVTPVLMKVAYSDLPDALRFKAVQGVQGEAAVLPALDLLIMGGKNLTVRLEAIHSVGLVGTDPARKILFDLAQNASLQPLIRQTAIQELRRSFGPDALDQLETLRTDPHPLVRNTALKAIGLVTRAGLSP